MKRLVTCIVSVLVLGCAAALAQEYVATPVTISKEKVKLNGKVYLSHVVQERQTLFGISQAYQVSVEELYQANPTLREKGLQKNAIILIPYHEGMGEVSEAPSRDNAYTEHTVRWYEDLEYIARRYNVSVKDLMEFNGLKSRKLTARQVLRIPLNASAFVPETPAVEVAAVPETPQTLEAETVQPEAPQAQPVQEVAQAVEAPAPVQAPLLNVQPKETVSFSLILPLQAGGNVSELNMDFYSGVLMALKDMEEQGTKVQMQVYDLAAGIPAADALARTDFVLGPVASRDIEAVLQRVEGRVPVISPLDQKAAGLVANYQSFIQVPAATDNQYEDLAQWVKDDMTAQDKVILVTEKGAGNVTASVALRSALARREVFYEILSYAIVEGRGIPAILTEQMEKNAVNRVVVASESEAFMGDVVRNVGIMLGKGYDVVMYAPSKVRTFDTIEGSDYHDASLHISTSYFADYSAERTEQFVRAYRALFQTEPSQFAFQGYDTARFFADRVARYGQDWLRSLSMERGTGLHTDFLFRLTENGNYQNQAVRRILYRKDYTTTLQR